MEFAREPYSQALVDEMLPLWREHYEEIASDTYGPLDPNLEAYEMMDKYNVLRIYTIRKEGKLIGYQIATITPHLHSKKHLTSSTDLIYVKPDERKGLLGLQFIRWCGEQLLSDGVRVMYMSVNSDHDFRSLLERAGFKHVDQIYAKKLSEEKNNG